jgi:transposase
MVHPRRGAAAIEAMGILPSFAATAVHHAWAPYDGYPGASHQLCCAHALRELQAVTDLAPAGEWCWATQAAEAITAMQTLVSEAIAHGHDAVDPVALAAQTHSYRSAALIGASQTAARSGKLMKKHRSSNQADRGRGCEAGPRVTRPRSEVVRAYAASVRQAMVSVPSSQRHCT